MPLYTGLKWLSWPRRAIVVFFFLVRAVPFLVMCTRMANMRLLYLYLSYFAQILAILAYAFATLAVLAQGSETAAACAPPTSWRHRAVRFALLYVLPFLVVFPIFVCIMTVAMVHEDGHIYTRNMHPEAENWPKVYGHIHSQDFFVHSLPALEACILLLALGAAARSRVRALWLHASAACCRAYGAYVVCVGLPWIVFYGVVAGGSRQYNDSGTPGRLLAIVAFLLFLGALLLWFLVPTRKELEHAAAHERAEERGAALEPAQRHALAAQWRPEHYAGVELELP